MAHGGKREGSGRKSLPNPLPVQSIRCTKEELIKLKLYLKHLRTGKAVEAKEKMK